MAWNRDDDLALEKTFRDASRAFTPPKGLKEEVLAALSDKGERSEESGRLGWWSVVPALVGRIARRPWFKFAATGTSVAAASLLLYVLLSGNRVALADVVKAVSEQTWVHVRYDNGREQWNNLRDGRSFLKYENGNAVVLDGVKGVRDFYFANAQVLTEGKIRPFSEGATPWNFVVGGYEKAAADNRPDVERHVETVAGKRLVRFDISFKDALGKRVLLRQLWADPETRLPVRERNWLQLGEREVEKREFITGEYDFPATGPKTIYDLGVPLNLEVVVERPAGAPESPAVDALLKASKEAQQRFPDHYRVILWPDKKNSSYDMIDLAYRAAEKICEDHYSNGGPIGEGALSLPATAAQVLEWARTKVPLNVGLYDGVIEYEKSGPFPPSLVNRPETIVQLRKLNPTEKPMLYNDFLPTDFQWPSLKGVQQLEAQQNAPGLLSGCIALTNVFGDVRRDFYVDPAHDYICVRWTWWKKSSGEWRKEREYNLSDFARLPAGQWYARKKLLTTYDDLEKGLHGYETMLNIDVEVLKENEYPRDIFNGKKLLEGAKAVTY